MPRARQRACLEHGLKLDINRLARQGVLDPNGVAGPAPIEWTNTSATRFCSRHAWRKQVAYASQFASPVDRAYRGRAKIKSRLIGNRDPDEWDLPPKPKWMRWRTYKQLVERFESCEAIIEEDTFRQLARLGIRG